jgi:serine/threonine protein kinase
MSRLLETEDQGKVNSVLFDSVPFIDFEFLNSSLSILFVAQTKSDIGPVCWMAPESVAKRQYSKKSDVWSFGIVGTHFVRMDRKRQQISFSTRATQLNFLPFSL